jgi:rhodanese-related sulfurtransferase
MVDVCRISPQEAHAKMTSEGYAYVDVRTEEEFALGRPAGAWNVPLSREGDGTMVPNADFLHVVETLFGKNGKLVVGCKSGNRSLRAAQALVQAGFTHVLEQRAGWGGARDAFGAVKEPGWSRAGLPTESGEPAERGYAALKKKGSSAR